MDRRIERGNDRKKNAPVFGRGVKSVRPLRLAAVAEKPA